MHIRDLPRIEAVLKDSTGKIDFVVVRFENYKRFVRKSNIEGSINEAEYLGRYKDVEKSIEDGKCRTATEHYLNTGYAEQRLAELVDSPRPTGTSPAPIEALADETEPSEQTTTGTERSERESRQKKHAAPKKSASYGTRSPRQLSRTQ